MKTKVLFCGVLAAALAALAGCQTAHIKTDEWEASINSHWFKRDVDKLTVTRTADGGYSIALNGYTGDASERLPQFTREMFAGLVALGQLFPMAARTASAAAKETSRPLRTSRETNPTPESLTQSSPSSQSSGETPGETSRTSRTSRETTPTPKSLTPSSPSSQR